MIIDKDNFLKKLRNFDYNKSEFETAPAKGGGFTVLCRRNGVETYLNSRYDPVKSGEQFAKSVYKPCDAIVVYGLGLGYHIKALSELLLESQTLYVFESCFATTKIAFEKTDIAVVLEKENIVFFCSDELLELASRLDDLINAEQSPLIIYSPSLGVIPDEMIKLKDVLVEYKSSLDMLSIFSDKMKQNLEINRSADYRNGVKLLSGAFRGMPAIVVAAGASLNLNAADLAKCSSKALIVSVARAAKTLYNAGVSPDFYVYTDSQSFLRSYLDYTNEKIQAPLFLLSTADANASNYRGEKLIIYEKESAPEGERDFFVETGGSVATAAISLCVEFGANPIIFVGQDLCYSFENSHSDGGGRKKLPLKASRRVLANDGNTYFTSGSLHIFLRWIERFIKRNDATRFVNGTARGAVIEGAPNIELLRFFEDYSDIRDEIDVIKKSKHIN